MLASNAALTAWSQASWALAISFARIGMIFFGYTGILVAANVLVLWLVLVITQASDMWPHCIPVVHRRRMR